MLPVKFQETVKIFRKYRSINQQHSSRIRGDRTLKPTACGCRKTTLLKSFRRHIRGNIPFEHSTDVTTIRGGKKSFSPSCNSFPPITWPFVHIRKASNLCILRNYKREYIFVYHVSNDGANAWI